MEVLDSLTRTSSCHGLRVGAGAFEIPGETATVWLRKSRSALRLSGLAAAVADFPAAPY